MLKKIIDIVKYLGDVKYLRENNLLLREIYWAEVFNASTKNVSWLEEANISPGRWAVNFSYLYILFRILNDVKPRSIIEFGMGQSTKMLAEYKKRYVSQAKITTVEHDVDWIAFFKKSNQIGNKIRLARLDLEHALFRDHNTVKYKGLVDFIKNDRYNLILVDGPFGADRYSRLQILDLIPHHLESTFCIVIDDYERPGEQDTVQVAFELLRKHGVNFTHSVYAGDKSQCLICSNDVHFLTSL